MKNKLIQLKTTYNEDGNIDQAEYLSTKKQLYQRQINFSIRTDAKTQQQFTLKPLQIGFLNSTALKDQQKFKDIKKIMTDYNKAILEKGGAAINGLHLKKVVMESMLKFMRLMMMAPDTGTKKLILNIAHHWFIRHLDPKSGRKSAVELLNQIKHIIIEKKLLPIELVNKELIINKVNSQLYPYRIKARTMYNQIDDPKHQLQHYNTHKLQFMGEHNKDNLNKKDHKKWIDTVKFPKIQAYQYAIEQIQVQNKIQNQAKPNLDSTKQQPAPDGQLPSPPLLDAQGNPIPPPQNKQVQNANEQQDLDFGAPPEEVEPQQEPQIQQDKKRGKLDPLLKLFVLQRIRNQKKEQATCLKIRQKVTNKFNSTQNEDNLNAEHLRQWAKTRARIKTQVSKRNQSMRGYPTIKRDQQQLDESISFVQNDINRIKVKSTIDQYKRNITQFQVPPDRLNTQNGLSLFDRRRVKTQVPQKPFSSILFDHSRKAEQTSALQEISDIKQKFSKYKIYTPMDNLIKGLAPPDKQYTQESQKIVWANSQLLSNPFIKVAKKKKKKKKK